VWGGLFEGDMAQDPPGLFPSQILEGIVELVVNNHIAQGFMYSAGEKIGVVVTALQGLTDGKIVFDLSDDRLRNGDEPVELAISQDVDTIVANVGEFVDAYNDVIDRIDELTSFDSETLERGVLFGDSTIWQLENRLFRSVTGVFEKLPQECSVIARDETSSQTMGWCSPGVARSVQARSSGAHCA